MTGYKIEAGTAQHIGSRPQQNDRTALFTGARAPGFVLAVLADGIAGGAAASEQVLHTAKSVFDQFRAGEHPTLERLGELLREIVHETHMVIKMNAVTTQTEQLSSFVGLILTPHREALKVDTALSELALWVERAIAHDFCGDGWSLHGNGDAALPGRILLDPPDEGPYRK